MYKFWQLTAGYGKPHIYIHICIYMCIHIYTYIYTHIYISFIILGNYELLWKWIFFVKALAQDWSICNVPEWVGIRWVQAEVAWSVNGVRKGDVDLWGAGGVPLPPSAGACKFSSVRLQEAECRHRPVQTTCVVLWTTLRPCLPSACAYLSLRQGRIKSTIA